MAVERYKLLSSIETVSDGFIDVKSSKDNVKIVVKSSQIDIKGKTKHTFLSNFTIRNNTIERSDCFPVQCDDVKVMIPSPSGNLMFILRNVKDNEQRIEIWNRNRLLYSTIFSKVHGDIYVDGWFQSFQWNSTEDAVLYVAEGKAQKTCSYWNEEELKEDGSKKGGNEESRVGEEYDFQEDWGEKYTGSSQPRLYVLKLPSTTTTSNSEASGGVVPKIFPVTGIPSNMSAGQAQWVPPTSETDSTRVGIIFTGWLNEPRRLGMIYCFNRSCGIYHLSDIYNSCSTAASTSSSTDPLPVNSTTTTTTIDSKLFIVNNLLTSGDYTARQGRFIIGGSQFIYLASNESNTHGSCFALKAFDWRAFRNSKSDMTPATTATTTTTTTRTIVDYVEQPESSSVFPGLYCYSLPQRCFTRDGSCVILSTAWRSAQVTLSVNIHTGEIVKLNDCKTTSGDGSRELPGALNVLDVSEGGILFSRSNFNIPTTFEYMPIDDSNLPITNLNVNKLKFLNKDIEMASVVDPVKLEVGSIQSKVIEITPPDDILSYEAILVFSDMSSSSSSSSSSGSDEKCDSGSSKGLPLIVFPHGGPHGGYTNSYSLAIAFMTLSGYPLLLVNYRGSTGFGNRPLHSLLGRIGNQDVLDTHRATEKALTLEYPKFDRNRIGVTGGSHGGFLACHLIGQYPSYYKAAATRNPVCNLASMVSITDIPDWCYTEAGLSYSPLPPSEQDLIKFRSMSPIRYLGSVQTPTLMLLGLQDRRVPPCSGLEYYHGLKSLGVECRLLVYPADCHALDKVATGGDVWVNMYKWFNKYM